MVLLSNLFGHGGRINECSTCPLSVLQWGPGRRDPYYPRQTHYAQLTSPVTKHHQQPYETHPELNAAQQRGNQWLYALRPAVQHCRAIWQSLHAPGGGFSTIGVTCLRRSRPVQSSFHPMPMTCGVSYRSGNETHVSPQHAPSQRASNISDAEGVTAAKSSYAQ